MLPWCETAEVDSGQAADSDGTDTVVECIYVADVIFSVAGIEYAGGDKGGECASNGWGQPADRRRRCIQDWRSQVQDVDAVEVEVCPDVMP